VSGARQRLGLLLTHCRKDSPQFNPKRDNALRNSEFTCARPWLSRSARDGFASNASSARPDV